MGDAIYAGGNDEPVRAAGIDTVMVRDVQETGNVIRGIVARRDSRQQTMGMNRADKVRRH